MDRKLLVRAPAGLGLLAETAESLLQKMTLDNSANGLTSETRDNIAVLLGEIESRKNRVRSKLNNQK